ncbi:putative gustatory receptor 22b isoform 2-T3 [Cochliomyia hominivorax]
MSQPTLTESRVLSFCFFAAFFTSRLLGAISYAIDVKSNKILLPTRFQLFYCGILHITYVLILPWALMSSYVRESAFGEQPFYILLNVAITVLRLPALFLTLLATWWGRRRLLDIITRFETLRIRYFHLLSAVKRREILKHNDILIYLKIFSSSSLIFSFFVRIFIFVKKPSREFIIFTVYFGLLEFLIIFKMNFFYCGMCYANCAVRYIREVLWQERDNITVYKIQEMIQIYMEVKRLVVEIRKKFQWEILSISLASMVALIALVFSFIISWQKSKHDEIIGLWHMFGLVFCLNAVLINILDYLLIAFVCCNTIKCSRRIRDVLLVINVQKELYQQKDIQKELNFLALQFSVNLPYVNICGLFNLTSSVTFAILRGTLTYLILLVQFDYKNWINVK